MLMLQDISGMKSQSCFNLRPTSENIQKLRYQLANPRFGEHHLFFLQSVGRILRLARGCTASSAVLLSELDVVVVACSFLHDFLNRRLMLTNEFYADFVAGDPYHFTLNMPSTHLYMLPAVVDSSGLQRYSDRVVDGIAAVFLALKRRPVIRYQRTSDTAKRIAHETAKLMYQHKSGLFDFRRLPPCLISGHIRLT
ncbi:hypothetical protein F2Q69_00050114 [Brassica cretica]|uniref:Uncharacterized protein n=1 Tax=Brassica cretica TaxID=69181 RepID=A0A8S9PWB5_BRACR|nr:hypothetical protein F2Q69_00050114 [Brassica cretica]